MTSQEPNVHVETSRLSLRPVLASDVTDLFRIYGDPATNTFNPAGPYPDIGYAKAVLVRWLDHWHTHGFGNWAISLRDHPETIIGFGGLSIRSYDDIMINNLGYRFSTDAWGKGLATEFATYKTIWRRARCSRKQGYAISKTFMMLAMRRQAFCFHSPWMNG